MSVAAVKGCSFAIVCSQAGNNETGKYKPPTIDSSAMTQLVPTFPCLITTVSAANKMPKGRNASRAKSMTGIANGTVTQCKWRPKIMHPKPSVIALSTNE